MNRVSEEYYIGSDAGSVSLNAVAINQKKELIYEFPYKRHLGKVEEEVVDPIKKVDEDFGADHVKHLHLQETTERKSAGGWVPRSDFGRCRACATACPAKVIQVEVEQVSLADGCLNCGRCVAACPTDALQLEGYSTPFELAAGTAPVEVECAKVPLRERAPGAVEAPCLGALSVGRIAELHEMAGPRGVALVDRG